MNRGTLCVHAGSEPEPQTGAVMFPVYFTSTYAQETPGKHKGYEYSRTKNPTRDRLERALAELEGGRFGLAFASGLAAEDAIFRLMRPGDEAVVCRDLYGGTFRLMKRVWENYGLKFRFIDTTAAQAAGAVTNKTRLVWIETPSNPLLTLTDIASFTRQAKKRAPKVLIVVDNTFATPVFQRPLGLGADIVVHSTTKYIGGHCDVVGGAVVVDRAELDEEIRFYQNSAGAVPSPMDCFLLLRGIKTLALRMRAHSDNAGVLSRYLMRDPRVKQVYYPGLAKHPNHSVARRQMDGFGGMVSFDLKGGAPAARKFFSGLKLFTVGESLGGVESLACYPWTMTHASIPEEDRRKAGVSDGLVRLSAGIENPGDLLGDIQKALSGISQSGKMVKSRQHVRS